MPHNPFCVRIRSRDLRHRLYEGMPDLCVPPVDGFLREILCKALSEGLGDAEAVERAAEAADARALVECAPGGSWDRLALALRADAARPRRGRGLTVDAAVPADCREDELRIYLVVRTDLALPRLVLAEVAARATWAAAASAMAKDDPRLAAYDSDVQAKIGLRVKSEGHLLRAAREAEEAGLPCGIVESGPGVPAALGVGPVRRRDLPRFVGSLQMLGDQGPEASDTDPAAPGDPGTETVLLLVRDDAGIPYGKLAPQAGHGLWAVASRTMAEDPGVIGRWEAAGFPVRVATVPDLPRLADAGRAAERAGLVAVLITDAGRTVFGRPTETVVGIGPCLLADLPPGVPRPPAGDPLPRP